MQNMSQKISAHNKQILDQVDKGASSNQGAAVPPDSSCNCRVRQNCPMDGKCLTKSVLYKATVDSKETYVGITEGTFKTRYTNHAASFRNPDKEHETKLSTYVWSQKKAGKEPQISWECLLSAPAYNPGLGRCILCLREKERIMYHREDASLNSRSEIISTCRHKRKFLLVQS